MAAKASWHWKYVTVTLCVRYHDISRHLSLGTYSNRQKSYFTRSFSANDEFCIVTKLTAKSPKTSKVKLRVSALKLRIYNKWRISCARLYVIWPAVTAPHCKCQAYSMRYIFTARCYASAVLAMGLCCVCVCVCLSQVGVRLVFRIGTTEKNGQNTINILRLLLWIISVNMCVRKCILATIQPKNK